MEKGDVNSFVEGLHPHRRRPERRGQRQSLVAGPAVHRCCPPNEVDRDLRHPREGTLQHCLHKCTTYYPIKSNIIMSADLHNESRAQNTRTKNRSNPAQKKKKICFEDQRTTQMHQRRPCSNETCRSHLIWFVFLA